MDDYFFLLTGLKQSIKSKRDKVLTMVIFYVRAIDDLFVLDYDYVLYSPIAEQNGAASASTLTVILQAKEILHTADFIPLPFDNVT